MWWYNPVFPIWVFPVFVLASVGLLVVLAVYLTKTKGWW